MEQTEERIDGAALELCARKVSASTGDLRQAIDFCRQSLLRGARKRPLPAASQSKHPVCSGRTCERHRSAVDQRTLGKACSSPVVSAGTANKIGCREVLEQVNKVYCSPVQKTAVPLQQKLLLATAFALTASGRKEFPVNRVRIRSDFPALVRVPLEEHFSY